LANTIELKGIVTKIWDARAMEVDGTRIGAPYKKDLADVTTGGTLVEGVAVVVQYSERGKWKNAESIQVTGAAAPTTAASSGDPAEKGGKHNRLKPMDFRHPDEITRIEVLKAAVATLTATGTLASSTNNQVAVVQIAKLAELYQLFIEDVVDAAFIEDQMSASSKPEPEAAPAQQEKKATLAAEAAHVASTQPGPTDDTQDTLTAFMNG